MNKIEYIAINLNSRSSRGITTRDMFYSYYKAFTFQFETAVQLNNKVRK